MAELRKKSETEENRKKESEQSMVAEESTNTEETDSIVVQEMDSDNDSSEDNDASVSNAFDITGKFRQAQPKEQPKKRELIGVTDKKVENKRILMFIVLCFGVAWFMEIFGVTPMYQSGDVDMVKEAADMISQLMLTPALAALVVRIATREGLVKSGFQFNFSEHRFLFLFGWFGTTALTFLGAVIYFLVFRNNFDPNMTGFVSSYSEKAAFAGAQTDAVDIVAAYKTDLLVKVFTAAVLDIINSFGEEWGFRAYLLPKLFRKVGTIPAMLLSGLASGLWYAPLVAIGYYYGSGNAGFPIVNIIAMCIFGMVTGVIYSFLCLRTGSIFPSVFAHSAVNVMMSQAALFTFDGGNFFVGPAPTGILSGLPFIITAVICLVYMHRHPIQASTE
ncbi:MAG: CPBP family intramembrane metalloprotease [Lachnospiraceae bacterium]|nr:CPBP family intramembrane metalloprotease [Lachnospiraceae bacterium]